MNFKTLFILLLLVSSLGNAQYIIQVNILGGDKINPNDIISIDAGSALTFRITNTIGHGCGDLRIQNVSISDTGNFTISDTNPTNIKPEGCKGYNYLDFTVTALGATCGSPETFVYITTNTGIFRFTFKVTKSPIISVLGGSPSADVIDGATTTTANNGTNFGVVEAGLTKTRNFIIVNTGSCALDISGITSSLPSNFIISANILLPNYTYSTYPTSIPPGSYIVFFVTFMAREPANNEAIISITNNTAPDTNLFTFTVKAEVFDVTGPGPGGVTADFRLWLKATRGVRATASKVSLWKDLGSNGKDAKQDEVANQPTYKDDVTSNINFNPVIEFDNSDVEQFLYNSENGFYSQDIFIVMIPDNTIESTSSKNTIFAGVSKKAIDDITYDSNDITGVGFGNYTSRFTNEVLTYGQNTDASFNGAAAISTSFANAGIINVRNDATVATNQELLYNSKLLSTSLVNDTPFTNVGYINEGLIWGTRYWIGKNYDMPGNLNGRVAEIMTFAQRVPDDDGTIQPDGSDNSRQKIETYLAIKYGITLGATAAEKKYVNSVGNIIWDHTANAGLFNYNIAGIGKDDNSDLNQKQSKSINDSNEVTIGLGVISATNSANINEFSATLDFLVWGCNNGTYTANGTNVATIGSGLSSTITKIDRKWKIVETGGDVENIFISIPSNDTPRLTVFSGFSKTAEEEFVLIVSETENFADTDIIDVIPLKLAGSSYQTWYDFDGTKYFTFGKAPKLTEKSAVNIAAGDYLVGEYALNLNINAFTISAWVRGVTPSANPRTIMAKGTKLQLRLNTDSKIEVMVDADTTPRFISGMALNDGKWHNVSFVYQSGTVFLYIDGILDKSEQGVNPPTPNYNHFSIGAVYVSKNDIRNPFLGEIDEVYVWDQGLSQDQIRYLMNQEVEIVAGDWINGKVMPQASPSNEITKIPIPWSKLKAYYDFNTFYGTTVEGLTREENFLRIKYLNKTKTIVGTQTAPLPYVSTADGVWGNAATWANSNVQNLPNAKGLDAVGDYPGTDIDWNIVETSHNITSGARNIEVLGLKINSGKITIDGTLDLASGTGTGNGLRVSHYLKLDGEINLAGESQLVQDEGSILDEKSGGFLDKDQQGTASSYNYNYWSSSVGPITAVGVATGIASPNLSFSVKGNMLDGTTPINFQPSHSAADLLVTPSPVIISSYWLYKFYGPDDAYSAWIKIGATTPLQPGEGYTMKGTSKLAAVTTNQNYKYRGKPYNGTIKLALDKTSGDVDRLIGNPYPSAIDANEFILDNIKQTIIRDGELEGQVGRNAVNVFNGALYFWHHFSGATHYLAEYVGGYATYTLMGGVQAYSTDSRINNSTPLVGGGKIPERYIPVSQGFFVITALPSGVTGTTTTVAGGEIIFKNSQRVFIKEGDAGIADGSLFFKGSKKTNAKQIKETLDEKAKIRLQFTSPKGYVRQLLVGIAENATNHFDIGYDAPMADVNKDDVFWTFDGAKFVIQAVNNFNSEQELPLGIIIAKAGMATIKIDELENLDENISLHIKDKLTGETHNISKKDFQINLDAGQYLDRFSLIFKMEKLVAEDISTEILIAAELQPVIEGIHVFMDNSIGELQIKNNNVEEILSVALYNYLGQRIHHWNTNLNRRIISLPINPATGVYIVEINTKSGKTVKKISVE